MPTKRLPHNEITLENYNPKDPLSAVKHWASGSYKVIQRALRNAPSITALAQESPNVLILVKALLRYANEYGGTKDSILKSKISTLYRGVSVVLDTEENTLQEKGFMSTSRNIHVAEEFATKRGHIYTFDVNSLPSDFKGILIDETIDFVFQEEEILFLPGTVTLLQKHPRSLHCKYKTNKKYIQQLLEMTTPQIQEYLGGGGAKMHFTIEDLMGTHLVFWRAIEGRPVELIETLHVPHTRAKALAYVGKHYRQLLADYDRIMYYIPTYMDLEKQYRETSTHAILTSMVSYSLHCAIVDPTTRTIKTTHWREGDAYLADIFDMKRLKEVEACLHQKYNTSRD